MTLQLVPFPASRYADWRTAQVELRYRRQFLPLWGDEATARERALAAVDQLAPVDGLSGTQLHLVIDDEGEAGWVWTVRHPGDLLVLDAEVRAPADALLPVLEAHARAGGADVLLVDRMDHAATTTALTAAAGFRPAGVTMVLDLGDPGTVEAPEAAGVRLVPMSEESFDRYVGGAVAEYAEVIHSAGAGTWDEALDRSIRDYRVLLPEGLGSPQQALFDVVTAPAPDTEPLAVGAGAPPLVGGTIGSAGAAGAVGGLAAASAAVPAGAAVVDAAGEQVGAVWLGLRPPAAAFVYDVHLRPEARGRGLGRAAMEAAAAWCRTQGIRVLGANVQGSNVAARAMYESLGYRPVVEELALPLAPLAPVTGPR
ncbi:GNAT family N-acetyltransferase [Puerhibacterium sp. TATVAM-FAB25]|uniref:GNAT family N-acetyltransferase n=1 Tax=Puerhibacterium sp. TATVAM-FAB25 TaxID=3093699 RepID=UPI0039791FD0